MNIEPKIMNRFENSKKIEIEVPADMSEETASMCFGMGMHNFIIINNGGISVTYGIQQENGDILVQAMTFKEDYAVATRKFCEAIRVQANLDSNEENLELFKEVGKKVLEELENENK